MRRRNIRLGIAVIAAVVVTCVVVWTVRNARALRSAESLVAELRAAGLPTRFGDLRPRQPVPPEENAAPLYQAAHALYQAVAAPGEAFASIAERPPRITAEDRRLLPAYDDALALVHRAARLRACDYQLEFEDGLSMRVPHLLQSIQLASTLSARALARAEDGRVEDTIEDVRAIFGMSRALRGEPLLVSQLVREKLNERALLVLEAVLPRAPSAGDALRRAEADTMAGALAMGLRGEIVSLLSLTDGEVLARYRAETGVPPEFRPGFLALPGYRANAVACARLLRRLMSATGEWAEVLSEAEAIEREARGLGMLESWITSCTGKVSSFARIESMHRLARLAALFLDQRRASGSYPESIEAVAGARDLFDPLTGGPFALRREEGWLVLHSRYPGPRVAPHPMLGLDLPPENWVVEWRLPAGK